MYSGTWSYGLESPEAWKFKLSCEVDKAFDFVTPEAEYVMKGYFIMKDDSVEAGKSKVPEEVRSGAKRGAERSDELRVW